MGWCLNDPSSDPQRIGTAFNQIAGIWRPFPKMVVSVRDLVLSFIFLLAISFLGAKLHSFLSVINIYSCDSGVQPFRRASRVAFGEFGSQMISGLI